MVGMTTRTNPILRRRSLASGDRRIGEELKNRILAARGDQVRKIILYGSRAQGGATPDSDFDLLVVEADPVVSREEGQQLRRVLGDLPVPVDVWVMGEQEFEETKDVIGGLAYPAHKYGVVLNEIG
jgi:predicted nucleotidyltransferase